jgi:hypothetical protein
MQLPLRYGSSHDHAVIFERPKLDADLARGGHRKRKREELVIRNLHDGGSRASLAHGLCILIQVTKALIDRLEWVEAARGICLNLHQSMRHEKLDHKGDNVVCIAQPNPKM